MSEPQVIFGTSWCHGGDPEDGGWHFTATGARVDGYDMAYQAGSRDAALALGVPAELLDRFEADATARDCNHPYDEPVPGLGLFEWLQDNDTLFESDEDEEDDEG